MSRSYILHFVTFIVSIAILFSMCFQSVATTFSGHVVDETGKPISGVEVALPGFRVTTPQAQDEPVFLAAQQAETDEAGKFSIHEITSPSVQLTLLPVRASEYEIRVVEIEGISFYPNARQQRFGGLTFAIASGADIKDVKITVRPRMRIRGRVLSVNGTPLRNVRVGIRIESLDIGGSGRGSSTGTRDLDPDGYFVEYVDEPALYTVSVGYQEQSATSEEILLEDGERNDDLVLTLDDTPPPKPESAVARIPDPAREHFNALEKAAAKERFKAAEARNRQGIWAINPKNRHAYKRVHCETREEARTQAAAEGAYLVAINDEAEEEWLLEVFGKEYFWIGLTDASREDKPHWDNGEPVTYTNWAFPEKIAAGKKSGRDEEIHRNYTVLVGSTGKWQETRQDTSLARIIEQAILEKERFTVGLPALDGDVEKR